MFYEVPDEENIGEVEKDTDAENTKGKSIGASIKPGHDDGNY